MNIEIIDSMNRNKIAIITARSGSKGLANKNMLMVNGKPLIGYTIEAALESQQFSHIIVSTDSQEYITALSHYPIEFIKRSAELASDTASSFVVIEDVLRQYQHIPFDYFVLLQPTSPLRTAKHIQEACQKFEQNFHVDYLVSVTAAHKPTTLTRQIDQDETLKAFNIDYSNYARQNYSPEYTPNGAIFSAKPQAYLTQKHFYGAKSLAYFMDKESSIDIDDRQDFDYFYFLLQQQQKENVIENQVKQRIALKSDLFNKLSPITLIGNATLALWHNHPPQYNNLAICGITAEQYQRFIFAKSRINQLSHTIILNFGINELQFQHNNTEIAAHINKLIQQIAIINPQASLYFLEIPPVAFRADVNNQQIQILNHYLKQHLQQVKWIHCYDKFTDQYGKLDLNFTDDGLNFNSQGYTKLNEILRESCKTLG